MRYSHRHARRLWRFLCPPALLYTEMISACAVLNGNTKRLLTLDDNSSPVALQLGGCEPAAMAQAAAIGESFGYDEININCGCPSPKVQKGAFGANLMKTPARVADIICAVKNTVSLPVTVKCRTAVDDEDADEFLGTFASAVIAAGADGLIVHARRAWLSGLNPAQNRNIPPLDYDCVRRLKSSLGDFPVMVNGGIQNIDDVRREMTWANGVMLGRAVMREPYLLAQLSEKLFALNAPTRQAALAYALEAAKRESPSEWRRLAQSLSGLLHGCANSRLYRRSLNYPIPIALTQLAKQGLY